MEYWSNLCDHQLLNATYFNKLNITSTNYTNYKECELGGFGGLVRVVYLYLFLLVFVYLKCCPPCSSDKKTRPRPPGQNPLSKNSTSLLRKERRLFVHHVAFWNCSFLLALFYFVQFGSHLLLILQSGDEANWGSSVSAYVQLLSDLLALLLFTLNSLFYHKIEKGGGDVRWLFNLNLYYGFEGILSGSKFILDLLQSQLTLLHVQLTSNLLICSTSTLIFALVAHTIYFHRRRRRDLSSEDEKVVGNGGEIVYVHGTSSLLSRLTFFWFIGILRGGYAHPLEESDLGTLPPQETTLTQFNRFQKVYLKQQQQIKFSIWKVLWTLLAPSMVISGLFRLAADFAGFVAPLGIKTIVAYTKDSNSSVIGEGGERFLTFDIFISNGYVMAVIVLLSSLLQSTFSQCSTFLVNSEGIHMKVALQALIYKKALRVAVKTDEVANLMSEDTNNIQMFFWMAHFIWAIPLKLAILMILLYFTLGYAALIGGALCILIMIPLQFIIATQMSSNSKGLMERCDLRLRAICEMLQGMRLLKTQGWELLFAGRVKSIREGELKHLDKDLLYRSLMTFLTHISTVVVTVVTFGLYPLLEEERLEPSKVFAGLALFNQLTVPLFIFPITVPVVIDALVSGRRIEEFLLLAETTSPLEGGGEDLEESTLPSTSCTLVDLQASSDSVFVLENIAEDEEEDLEHLPHHILNKLQEPPEGNENGGLKKVSQWVIRVQNGSFGMDEPILNDITLDIPKEQLTVVVGATGSGKSSLISALLGEMTLLKGQLHWAKGTRVAYAAQSAWMLNASVRENIIFGRGFRARRYKRVIEACALQPDIDILPDNDATEIGDKGINLSGGQKQRIAIARALYSTANLVILDDPLSALDVQVAHHVLDIGIRKFLMRSHRTVILVTHHLPVLHHANHIVAMEKGSIRIQGSLKEIREADFTLYEQWDEMISKKEAELQRQLEAKTAKERWTLLKLVSKIGLQFRSGRPAQNNPSTVDENQEPFRKRKPTFSHYKNLSHDIFLPSDECHHDEIMTPLLRRRPVSRASRDSRASGSSNKHMRLERMSSLQDKSRIGTSPLVAKKFLRLQSMPVDEEIRPGSTSPRRHRSEINRIQGDNLWKRLLSVTTTKKTVSSAGSSTNVDLELKEGTKSGPLASTQSEGDLTEEDPDEENDPLIEGEGGGEEREYGTVPLRIYLIYIKACGPILSLTYLLFVIGYEAVRVLTNLWLSRWSDNVSQEGSDSAYEETMSYYFKVYVCLSLLTVGVSLTCNLLGKRAGGNSRKLLHGEMMDRLVRAPLSFFETTPIGRIINRFSSDVAVVDRKLCISMQRFLQFVFLCVSAIVVNGLVNPWFLLVAIPVVAIYYFIQRFYRFSSRELQRLQAISRGPIYSHFHETLQGLSTIRAFCQEARFTNQMFNRIDINNRADIFINVGNRWLSISLDYLGSVIVFLSTVGAMLSSELYPELVTPSIVGLAINYTLLVPVYLNWVVKFLAEVEMFMNSVDRLDKYSHLEIENYQGEVPPPPPNSWPSKGELDFQNVSIQYGPERPPIISNLNLKIQGREKVGFCGRSGCGKSSLLMSLFRISQLSGGKILVDGVDISKLPLLALRSSLSIIPQENIVFSGTLRFNLDPRGLATDQQIWQALELAQIKETIQLLPGQLDEEVGENGSSFSAGQKQLLALARAILHKSKLIIMDEATSSVDLATEQTLLTVVKEAFKDSTLLTIAHRLETIVDGERVIVLEDGKILEDGRPSQLISRKPQSQFAKMLRADVHHQ